MPNLTLPGSSDSDSRTRPRHTLRVVSRRTGLTGFVLRAWERRYGAVIPARSAGRQRLYSDADIERLTLLARGVHAGYRIGELVKKGSEELAAMVRDSASGAPEGNAASAPPRASDADVTGVLDEAMRATASLDAAALESLLSRAAVHHRVTDFLERIAVPLLVRIGEAWHSGEISPAHEHLATTVVRRILERLADAAPRDVRAPSVVLATPPRQLHELGAMVAAAEAAAAGWRVVHIGPNLPGEDIARAALQTGARAVALSLVHPAEDPELFVELQRLRSLLPKRVVCFAGGAAAFAARDRITALGFEVVDDAAAFRAQLVALSPSV